MPGGNDNEVNALYEIACNTRQMALNAGASPPDSGFVNDEAALSNIIACNMALTITGLGGTCLPTWVDQATAWQAILIMSVELASLTGTPSNQGFLELPLAGVLCNLQQVAQNTGTAVPPPENLNVSFTGPDMLRLDWDPPAGPSPDSFNIYRSLIDGGPYTLLTNVPGIDVSYDDFAVSDHKTYYYVLRSVTGGIESVDSNQASGVPQNELDIFTLNLLQFSPDLLIIADAKVGNIGDPVPSAPDSSGNGNDMTRFIAGSGVSPTIETGPNGRRAYGFTGLATAGSQLSCPFILPAGQPTPAVITVSLFNAAANATSNSGRICGMCQGAGGGDAGAPAPIFNYFAPATQKIGSFYASGVQTSQDLVDNTWVSTQNWLTSSAPNQIAHAITKGVLDVVTPSAPIGTDLSQFMELGGTNSSYSTTKIAFHAAWKTSPSEPDLAAFLAIVNNYYGL